VAPTVLLFDRIAKRAAEGSFGRTAAFLAGYLFAWVAFSALATMAQVELIALGWVDDMGVAQRSIGSAALLAGVGIYQWLPAKRACLAQCRSPVEFLVSAYRPGAGGALQMGLRHGLYCLGCCWALMLLLFVGGVMNLLWVAGIAAVVFVEKLLARGEWLRRTIGIAAMLAAVGILL
jgi:predicted metal-binding membrane protein